MRAARAIGAGVIAVALVVAVLTGVYVPLRLLEMLGEKAIDSVTAGVLSLVSIIAGAAVAVVAIVVGIPLVLAMTEEYAPREEERGALSSEKLAAYRARQRAMLEELDEVKKLLEEVRDLLKEGVGV